jgi:hydrogenase maturation protease
VTDPRAVVIGVGNAYRSDDAAGLVVAERLRARTPDGVAVVACEQEVSRLIDAWRGAGAAVVVDAVASGAEPGTLHRFDASERPLPARVFRSSTHAFGIGEAIELSRALGTLPGRVVVHGVEGADFTAGERMSAAAAAAVGPAAEAVLQDLEELCTSAR